MNEHDNLGGTENDTLEHQTTETEIVKIGTKDDCSIIIKIGDRDYRTLWESGAGKCVISLEKYKKIPSKFKTELFKSHIKIKAANGSSIENSGECDITFKIGNEEFAFPFLVSSTLTQEVILGYNFSRAFHIGTGWNKFDEIYLTMNRKQLTTTISTTAINDLVQCAESIVIPPRSNALIKCKAPKITCCKHYERICVFEPANRHKADFSECHTYEGTEVMDDEVRNSGIFHIAMTNQSGRHVKVTRNDSMHLFKSCAEDKVCTIHRIVTFHKTKEEPKPKVLEKSMYAIPVRNKSGRIEINTLLAKQDPECVVINELGPQEDFVKYQKPRLQDAPVDAKVLQDLGQLLEENPDAFAQDETQIGTTPLNKMSIDTGDHKPIAKQPYTLSLKHYDWVRNEIDKLLQAGVIRESHLSWSSPVVIVTRSNGEKRLGVDFRALNSITRTYLWPIPRVEDIFSLLGKAKLFTTLDLDDDAIKKTAFILPFGKFEYIKVPFGLAQAPAYFQNLMNKVLNGLPFAIAYLDDIIIFSETPKQHLAHIRVVLKRLQAANLRMKRRKCSFFKELHYLGHLLTTKGIKPQLEKVKAISELKPPKTQKGIREFLGMVGYYRKFIHRFADAARPLTKLTRKGIKFEWSKDCRVGFDYLKDCLIKDPVLKYPDPTKRYVVSTDASDQAAAAILTQEYPDSDGKITELPVA